MEGISSSPLPLYDQLSPSPSQRYADAEVVQVLTEQLKGTQGAVPMSQFSRFLKLHKPELRAKMGKLRKFIDVKHPDLFCLVKEDGRWVIRFAPQSGSPFAYTGRGAATTEKQVEDTPENRKARRVGLERTLPFWDERAFEDVTALLSNKTADAMRATAETLTCALQRRVGAISSGTGEARPGTSTQKVEEVEEEEDEQEEWLLSEDARFDPPQSCNSEQLAARREAWARHRETSHRYQQMWSKKQQQLPACQPETISSILDAVENNPITIIFGETGCGKTTQVPQFLLDDAIEKQRNCNIICTQPRRISAVSIAQRVAEERDEVLGQTVGYQIRFERKASSQTSLLFCTQGILLRRLQSDPRLENVTHVVVDEIHERDCLTDFCLLILRDLIKNARPDLKLIFMSATMDPSIFKDYFMGKPSVPYQPPSSEVYTSASQCEEDWPLEGRPVELEEEEKRSYETEKNEDDDKEAEVEEEEEEEEEEDEDEDEDEDEEETEEDSWENKSNLLIPLPTLKGLGEPSKPEVEESSSVVEQQEEQMVAIMHIKGRTYPIEKFFLEDVLEYAGPYYQPRDERQEFEYRTQGLAPKQKWGNRKWRDQHKKLKLANLTRQHDMNTLLHQYSSQGYSQRTINGLYTLKSWCEGDPSAEFPVDLVVGLVSRIHRKEGEGAILIFLPGWDTISLVHKALLETNLVMPNAWELHALHSMVPMSQQRKVFEPPSPGKRKVVIATNIAETSITIEDVVYVVDSGFIKQKGYEPVSNLASLTPVRVSRANAAQRSGRAGRCRPGKVFHLFTRYTHDNELEEYQLPEMIRTPAEELCMHVKALQLKGKVAQVLSKAVSPPDSRSISNAVNLLEAIGAFDQEENLTKLGKQLAVLPVHPQLGKLLIAAAALGCVDPVLTIVAGLGTKSPFQMVLGRERDVDAAKRALARGCKSDHLTLVHVYDEWLRERARGDEGYFCNKFFLSPNSLQTISNMRGQFMTILKDLGYAYGPSSGADPSINDNDVKNLNRNSKSQTAIQMALCASLYPNLVHIHYPSQKKSKKRRPQFYAHKLQHRDSPPTGIDLREVRVHPSSINAGERDFFHRWMVYYEIVKSVGGVYVRDSTLVNPLVVILMAGGEEGARFRSGHEELSSSSSLHGQDKQPNPSGGYPSYLQLGSFALQMSTPAIDAVRQLRQAINLLLASKASVIKQCTRELDLLLDFVENHVASTRQQHQQHPQPYLQENYGQAVLPPIHPDMPAFRYYSTKTSGGRTGSGRTTDNTTEQMGINRVDDQGGWTTGPGFGGHQSPQQQYRREGAHGTLFIPAEHGYYSLRGDGGLNVPRQSYEVEEAKEEEDAGSWRCAPTNLHVCVMAAIISVCYGNKARRSWSLRRPCCRLGPAMHTSLNDPIDHNGL
ncbi:3'-5' RNA helicase ythdc2 [Balamuthia mandrillaris]